MTYYILVKIDDPHRILAVPSTGGFRLLVFTSQEYATRTAIDMGEVYPAQIAPGVLRQAVQEVVQQGCGSVQLTEYRNPEVTITVLTPNAFMARIAAGEVIVIDEQHRVG